MGDIIATYQTSEQKFMKMKNDKSSVVYETVTRKFIMFVYSSVALHNSWFKDLSNEILG